ncbi:MAG: prepilin-type N-terminal cleavage/methylation domain-containing protein, partial [Psychrobacter nivimaris]
MRHQRGFTLLELMVAMAIFAMLAVAGWQVFDGVNRARER